MEKSKYNKDILTRSVTVCVKNELGIHARPAAVLAQEAQKFDAQVHLLVQGETVDARSILDILTLALSQGSKVTLEASGQDADNALARIEELFTTRFGEAR